VGSKVKAGKEGAGGNLIANTDLTTWVAPISTPAEIRQYRKGLYDTVAALPFATVVPAPISGDESTTQKFAATTATTTQST
jgi:hypothetical protein